MKNTRTSHGRRLNARKLPLTRRPATRPRNASLSILAKAGIGAALVMAAGGVTYVSATGRQNSATAPASAVIVHTAPTLNDSAVKVSGKVGALINAAVRAHERIRLVRIEGDGSIGDRWVDLTPRVGGNPSGDVLEVPKRVSEAAAGSVAKIEQQINAGDASVGSRALLAGLEKIEFTAGTPVVIYSSGLDLTDPLDFRALAFDVSSKEIVEMLKSSRELPTLKHNPVTFVLVPSAGEQAQLRRPQTDFLKDTWGKVLKAGGASSVEFVTAAGTRPSSTTSAPTVTVPPPPDTPIPPMIHESGTTTCTLDAPALFHSNSARLIDPDASRQALRACAAQVGTATTITVEGHTAYTGKPNNPEAILLSKNRARAIVKLLVGMGISRSQITSVKGYGNARPVVAEPSDPLNRCVVVSFINPK